MGQSTDGEISYGILFDEDFKFPWNKPEFENDIAEWWLYAVHQYPRPTFFNSNGEYLPGYHDDTQEVTEYYTAKFAFRKANPIPVQLVNYCSSTYPMYILALPNVGHVAHRGYPTVFNPAELVITAEQRQALLDFCQTYSIQHENEPQWYLSSCWR